MANRGGGERRTSDGPITSPLLPALQGGINGETSVMDQSMFLDRLVWGGVAEANITNRRNITRQTPAPSSADLNVSAFRGRTDEKAAERCQSVACGCQTGQTASSASYF